jgi:hypothetical protein
MGDETLGTILTREVAGQTKLNLQSFDVPLSGWFFFGSWEHFSICHLLLDGEVDLLHLVVI